MLLVAAAAAAAAAVRHSSSDAAPFLLILFVSEYAFPAVIIYKLYRIKSNMELLAIVSLLCFLAWGSLAAFRPGGVVIRAPHEFIDNHSIYTINFIIFGITGRLPDVADWAPVRRWNWGLLALLYSALLAEALASRAGRGGRRPRGAPAPSRGQSARPRAWCGFLVATFGLAAFLGSVSMRGRWLTVLGPVSLLFVSAAIRRDTRGVRWLLRRSMLVVPAALTGGVAALVWNEEGPVGGIATAIAISVYLPVFFRGNVLERPRISRLITVALAFFWSFAALAQFALPTPLPSGFRSNWVARPPAVGGPLNPATRGKASPRASEE